MGACRLRALGALAAADGSRCGAVTAVLLA